METWKEHYHQAAFGRESMVHLIRGGMQAVEQSSDMALRRRIATERFLTPYVLCDVLDAHGVPVPNDGAMPLIMRNTERGATVGRHA